MQRLEAIKTIYPLLKDQIVVTNMGAAAVELFSLGHRPNFFYMEHSMGLASSLGLGLSLCLPKHQVTVIDGDASVLMNLGTLSTMGRYLPANLIHLIFDNESLLSVGGFPSATSTGTDLAGVASSSGVQNVARANSLEDLDQAFADATGRSGLSVLVSKVDAVGPASFAMDIGLMENRLEFGRYLKGLDA